MPTMLDYERLLFKCTELEVENSRLKNADTEARRNENRRWDNIEAQPEIGTKSEEARLRRIIREWEERYDILNELYVRAALGKPLDWWTAKDAAQERKEKEKHEQVKKKVPVLLKFLKGWKIR